jgi:hypothetical protein
MAVTFRLIMHDVAAGIVAPKTFIFPPPAIAVIVAAVQELEIPFGVAITSPDGSVSEKPTPLNEAVAFGFAMVKVKPKVELGVVPATPKLSLIEGGKITARVAKAVPPVPPSIEVTAPVVLFCTPVATLVTFTLNVQDELVDRLAFERLIVLPPVFAAIVPPLHEPLNPLGVETTSPAGSVSVKPMPLKEAAALGFAMIKLRLVLPFNGIDETPNVLVMSGGATFAGGPTVRLADAVLPVPALVDVTAPVVLVRFPVDVPFTVTLNVHDPFAAMPAPVKVTPFDPAAAVMLPPPQEPVNPLGVATTSPAGKVSVNATPVMAAVFAAGLVMLKLRLVVAFCEI